MKENFKSFPRNKKIIEFDFDLVEKLKIEVERLMENNFENMNTRVLSEPILLLLLLSYPLEKLSIY